MTRVDYFETAMDLLATEGAGRMKIAVLCKRLKVTTGSFYGYFGSLDGFIAAFLDYWEEQQTIRIEKVASELDDSVERVLITKQQAAQIPHDAEAAIRSWAHTNEMVRAAQKRVDEHRLRILTNLLVPGVPSRDEAERLAVVGMTLLVGLQQWRSPITASDFDLVFDSYEQMVVARMTTV